MLILRNSKNLLNRTKQKHLKIIEARVTICAIASYTRVLQVSLRVMTHIKSFAMSTSMISKVVSYSLILSPFLSPLPILL